MAAWNIDRALDTAAVLEERWPDAWQRLRQQLALDETELHGWRQVAKGLVRGDDAQTGLIEQFAGYFALEPIDLAAYASRTAPMDVVLGRERTAASQVVKQADVVALLAVLPDLFDRAAKERNFAYSNRAAVTAAASARRCMPSSRPGSVISNWPSATCSRPRTSILIPRG